jgi:hypothetical protein
MITFNTLPHWDTLLRPCECIEILNDSILIHSSSGWTFVNKYENLSKIDKHGVSYYQFDFIELFECKGIQKFTLDEVNAYLTFQ